VSFDVALKAGRLGIGWLIYDLVDARAASGRRGMHRFPAHVGITVGKIDEWQRTVLRIQTSNEEFYRCYSQGVQDMAALRLPLEGTDHMVFVPAAGLPWFVALSAATR